MPRDAQGVYSLPPGYLGVTGQTILASQHNAPLEDIAEGLTNSLPRSGAAAMVAPLNLGGFKVINVAEATNDGDAIPKSQFDAAIDDLGADHIVANKAINYTATDADFNIVFQFTASATLSFTAVADLRDFWFCTVWANGGDVTIDPNLSETINGVTSIIVKNGQKALVYRTSSTTFIALLFDDSFYGASATARLDGLGLSISAGDPTNDIDIAIGVAASDETIPNLMVLSSVLTKRTDSGWVVGSGNGGLDTGTIADGTYYVWLIQRTDTGVIDALFSLSSTSPTMPANYTRKRLVGPITRVSSALIRAGDPVFSLLASSSAARTNFPIGQTLTVVDASPNRGAIFSFFVKASNQREYTANGADSAGTVVGTWISTGAISATVCTAQRLY